ncbi:MAG TPA: transcription termination/antitermination NusG family protein [Candidatus Dormibacteraeota bacterium]|nr:transcription termination/antitermination NusG family protein [Candidatus Dormibacteraeota bacterium]
MRPNPWFALHVRNRYETSVTAHLGHKGYTWFLPLEKSRRRWSDRFKEVEKPLFPGYVFCRFDPFARLPILITPGVIGVVGIGKMPIAIEDAEIANLQRIIESGLPRQPWPFLQIGERARIEAGPLHGLEGILLGFKGSQRLILSVTLLQRSVAVEIDSALASPVLDHKLEALSLPGEAMA